MTAVLDASAVLALLFGEPGAETVVDHIAAGATISLAELGLDVTVITIRTRQR